MSQQQITINIPEGFEVADGAQPRLPKESEYYLAAGVDGIQAIEALEDFRYEAHIILKKKWPKYSVLGRDSGLALKYVEIKAIKDLLSIHDKRYAGIDLTDDEHAQLNSLKQLVEGE